MNFVKDLLHLFACVLVIFIIVLVVGPFIVALSTMFIFIVIYIWLLFLGVIL